MRPPEEEEEEDERDGESPSSTRPASPSQGHALSGQQSAGHSSPALPSPPKKKKKKRWLWINLTNCKYESVRRAARRFGLKVAPEGEDWTVYWTDSSLTLDRLVDMRCYQKINHFPGMSELCRKDMLARNMNRMVKRFPKEYNIFPRTWCLPADYSDFQAYTRVKKNKTFICKPDTGSQGRGIYLTRSSRDVPHGEHMICQVYISRPFVIDGFKFDLRIYVLVTSCDPFRIFLYNEGLARFCTSPYSHPTRSNVEDVCMHLTNYAINKHSENFVRDDIAGSKRKLSTLTRLLAAMCHDTAKLWADIEDVVIKALVSAHAVLRHSYHTCFPRHAAAASGSGSASSGACFEILGFDVLLDHRLKPWLLEVNHSPSFSTDSRLDREVKDALLYDTLVLLNLGATDRRRANEEERRRVRERLQHVRTRDTRSEEQRQQQADGAERALGYEDAHLGGYRRIYPRPGGGGGEEEEEYGRFLLQGSSLFQDTAASRAREKCTREQLQELQTQRRGGGPRAGGLQGESAHEGGATARKAPPSSSSHQGNPHRLAGVPHFLPSLSTVTQALTEEEEEEERVQGLRRRADLLRALGVVDQVYLLLKGTPSYKNITVPSTVKTDSGQYIRDMAAKRESLGGPAGREAPPPPPSSRPPWLWREPEGCRNSAGWPFAERRSRGPTAAPAAVFGPRQPQATAPRPARERKSPPASPGLRVVAGPALFTQRYAALRPEASRGASHDSDALWMQGKAVDRAQHYHAQHDRAQHYRLPRLCSRGSDTADSLTTRRPSDQEGPQLNQVGDRPTDHTVTSHRGDRETTANHHHAATEHKATDRRRRRTDHTSALERDHTDRHPPVTDRPLLDRRYLNTGDHKTTLSEDATDVNKPGC